MHFLQALGQDATPHARHHHVGKQQRDRALVLRRHLQRRHPIVRHDDVVPQLLQLTEEIARSVGLSQRTVRDYLGRFRSSGIGWPVPPALDAAALEA